METRTGVAGVEITGGHPALDLVDTIGGLVPEGPSPEDDFFRSFDDLVALGLWTKTISEETARRLRRAARDEPRKAQAAFERAVETRALLDDVFRPLADGGAPPPVALEELATLDATALERGRLVPANGGYAWSWDDAPGLDAPLWPIVHSAVELITDGPLDRVSRCGRCRWLFLDTTKNHSRRWCSMEGCGTDTKKERYVARRRERRRRNP